MCIDLTGFVETAEKRYKDEVIRGFVEGKIDAKIETIQTIVRLRFKEQLERFTSVLEKVNNLSILEKVSEYALTTSFLADLENYAEDLYQEKYGRRLKL